MPVPPLRLTPDAVETDMTTLRTRRGAALRAARNRAGLSAQKLANRVNLQTRGGSDISKDAIYAYESAKVLLPHEVGVRLAQVLNLHAGELLAGDPAFRTAPADDSTGIDGLNTTAPPTADTPTGRWLRLASEPVQVANVLARTLDARTLGDDQVAGFQNVFNLLRTDLRTVIRHAVADTVRDAQRREGWDELHNVLSAAEAFEANAQTQLKNLLGCVGEPLKAEPAGLIAAEALRQGGESLQKSVRSAERMYQPR